MIVRVGHLPLMDKDISIVRSAITFIVFGVSISITLCSINFAI